MFLLSYVPIGLTGSYNNNPSTQIDSLEAKIQDLEGLLTATRLGDEFDANPETTEIDRLDNCYYKENGDVNIGLVQRDLKKARIEDLQLRSTSDGSTGDVPSERLEEINYRINVAVTRIMDLQKGITSLIEGQPYDTSPDVDDNGDGVIDESDSSFGYQAISGLVTPDNPHGDLDANVIRKALREALAYKRDLESAKIFWETAGGHTDEEHIPDDLKSDKIKEKVETRLKEVEIGIEAGIQKNKELEELLASDPNLSVTGVKYFMINGVQYAFTMYNAADPNSPSNALLQDLYRQRALIGELITQSKTLNNILRNDYPNNSANTETQTGEIKPELQHK